VVVGPTLGRLVLFHHTPWLSAPVFGTYAHQLVTLYRTAYGLHLVNGILFNHESPRRGANFVTMKTINAVKRHVVARDQENPPPPPLKLGNLNSQRDWGYAKEYVEGMWRMLQEEKADDSVLATGQTRTVREFVTEAFRQAGFELEWSGEGVEERAVDQGGVERVRVSERYFRPTEVPYLLGMRLRRGSGWGGCRRPRHWRQWCG
jgi:GDPmannose 4,6-dehydratase